MFVFFSRKDIKYFMRQVFLIALLNSIVTVFLYISDLFLTPFFSNVDCFTFLLLLYLYTY